VSEKTLLDRLKSRRDRDNLGTAEWDEVIDKIIAATSIAAENERLRGEVARLEGLLRSVGPKRVAARRA
jgi:hypothetical protein